MATLSSLHHPTHGIIPAMVTHPTRIARGITFSTFHTTSGLHNGSSMDDESPQSEPTTRHSVFIRILYLPLPSQSSNGRVHPSFPIYLALLHLLSMHSISFDLFTALYTYPV
jgi:hypothetical protein